MEWQSQLISIYLSVCKAWDQGVSASASRLSNNGRFKFTDEEVISIYLFGIIEGCTTIRGIYEYAYRHLREWFPFMGGYEAYSYRLNKISNSFPGLCDYFVHARMGSSIGDWVVDSFPIIMAGPKRSSRARVASDMADKGYCASKNLYFYGVKLHCVGGLREGTIPLPIHLGMAPASVNDNWMFEQISPELRNGRAFADKAYADMDHQQKLAQNQNVLLLTPIKKTKGLFSFSGGDTFSSWISSIRQPIESLFNWLQEKTKIQNASKVRSSAGLIVHIFGRIAAALLTMAAQHST